MQQIYDPLEAF